MSPRDEDDNSGEASICTRPEYAPIHYHWYARTLGEKPLHAFKQIIEEIGLNATDSELFVGSLRATMNLLRRGQLRPLHEVKGPMRAETRLRIFEIRLSHEYNDDAGVRREVHVRLYHVEPKPFASTTHGSIVIGLHIHHKDIDVDEVVEDQDAEIRVAARRYFEGRDHKWSLLNEQRST